MLRKRTSPQNDRHTYFSSTNFRLSAPLTGVLLTLLWSCSHFRTELSSDLSSELSNEVTSNKGLTSPEYVSSLGNKGNQDSQSESNDPSDDHGDHDDEFAEGDMEFSPEGSPGTSAKDANGGKNSKTKSQPDFDWPVDKARFVRGFNPKRSRKRRPHYGIDLAAIKGTPILAATKGTVIYTGRAFKGYGRMVMIESENGWATLYAHLNKIYVAEGQKVASGEVLGAMGRTGRATGVHLHFEIRKGRVPMDPLTYLPADPSGVASR